MDSILWYAAVRKDIKQGTAGGCVYVYGMISTARAGIRRNYECTICRYSSYRAVNTLRLSYKNQ
jgi:hypothetical protein